MERSVRRYVPRLAGLVAGLAATLIPLPSPATAQPSSVACTWVVNELPLPAGMHAGHIYNSDRDDSFAGYGIGADGKARPLVWNDGAVTVLAAPAGQEAFAQDVNSRGDVVGVAQGDDTPTHGVLWRGGQMIDLPMLPGGGYAVPTAINDAGLIVGYASTGDGDHAVTWSTRAPRAIRDLGGVAGSAYLTDVTERGTIVGWTESTGDGPRQQAIAGTVRNGLTALPGPVAGSKSMARAAAGRYIAGVAVLTGDSHDFPSAVRWEPAGPQALPGVQPDAQAVNDLGTVVGSDTNLGAVIWLNGIEQPLPALTPGRDPLSASSATVVTNHNTAAGASVAADGRPRPVTWSARCG